jgi:SAM-dependent methyltransferase
VRKWLFALLAVAILSTYPIARALEDSGLEEEIARLSGLLVLKPGMTVADVGAGNGRATVIIARTVGPQGRVFSTEIDPDALEDIREAARKAGLQNVTVVTAAERDTGLPPGCCDAIFARSVYHHLSHPAETNRSLWQALRPGGRLALIDFPPAWWLRPWKPKNTPDRGGHGIAQNVLINEVTAAGFEVEKTIAGWSHRSYCVVFRKKAL